MTRLSDETEMAISRRMATGQYESVDALLCRALDLIALQELDWNNVREHLLRNLREGDAIEMTPGFWADAMAEAGIEQDRGDS